MNFSISHIHILQNSPPTPPYADFRACQEARAKLPRGSYEGQGPSKRPARHQGGPGQGQGTSKQASKIPVPQKGGKGKGKARSKCPPPHKGQGQGRPSKIPAIHKGQGQGPIASKIPAIHKGGPGQGPSRCPPPQQRGSGLGSQPLFSGGFQPPIRPPTGSLVAAINLLSKRKC